MFENWNEYDAYFYGYFVGDGCLKKENQIRGERVYSYEYLEIKSKDIDHLRKISLMCLGKDIVRVLNTSNGPIGRLKYKNNEKVAEYKSYGICYRKSEELEYLEVPVDLLSHFIRGLFDADGSVSLFKNGIGQSYVAGNKVTIDKIEKYLPKSGNRTKLNKVHKITFSSKSSIREFYNLIYSDFNIAMSRKYNIYSRIVDDYCSSYYRRKV